MTFPAARARQLEALEAYRVRNPAVIAAHTTSTRNFCHLAVLATKSAANEVPRDTPATPHHNTHTEKTLTKK